MRAGKYVVRCLLWAVLLACVISAPILYAAENAENTEAKQDAAESSPNVSDQKVLEYVALGDSIPNGYFAADEMEVTGYPQLVADDLGAMGESQVNLSCYTKNGLTTGKLYERYLADSEVKEQLKKADMISLTIGANDLLIEFRSVSQEILNIDTKFRDANSALTGLKEGIADNPLLLVKVAAAIGGWDYESFEHDWIQAMESIEQNRKENVQMVVTTIYNPVSNMELPGTLNIVVDTVINGMNDIIIEYADEYDYQVADLFASDIGVNTQSDGLHPNQEGQELIKELVEEQLDIGKLVTLSEEEGEQLQEAEEMKAEQRAKEKQEGYRKTGVRIILSAVLIIGLGICLYRYRRTVRRQQRIEKE
ncbi:SGNH/GDSL hydrolase family protein [Bariatricus sp. SGI.154]|uniref:SGNH/GDSL hydrolase family protein n=1 Tax=Bariatricus sp. SGI.154 TaxID=3420549 RepID=UPI003D027E87